MNDGTYRPFHKTNEEATYSHGESDHPQQIIKKVSRSIEKNYLDSLQQRKYLKIRKDYYEQRLRQFGYNEKLNYPKTKQRNKSKISEAQHTLVQPTLQQICEN